MRAATSAETAALILGMAGVAAVCAVMVVGVCDRGLVCTGGFRISESVVANADRVWSTGVVAAEQGALEGGIPTLCKPKLREEDRVVRGIGVGR